MGSILFPIGVLVVSAVTAAEGLHDYVHDHLSNRKARKEEQKAREKKGRHRDDRSERRSRRGNTSFDAFSEDASRYSNHSSRRPERPLVQGFDHPPLPNPPLQPPKNDMSVDLYRPRYDVGFPAQDYVDPWSQEARQKRRDGKRNSLYGYDRPEETGKDAGNRSSFPAAPGSRTTNLGRSASLSTNRNQELIRRPTVAPSLHPGHSASREVQRMSYREPESVNDPDYSPPSQLGSLNRAEITRWASQVSQHPVQNTPDFTQPFPSRHRSMSNPPAQPDPNYPPSAFTTTRFRSSSYLPPSYQTPGNMPPATNPPAYSSLPPNAPDVAPSSYRPRRYSSAGHASSADRPPLSHAASARAPRASMPPGYRDSGYRSTSSGYPASSLSRSSRPRSMYE